MKASKTRETLSNLVAVKRRGSEQRLRNLSSEFDRCQASIDKLVSELHEGFDPSVEFVLCALSARNNLSGRRAFELLKLKAKQAKVEMEIKAEQIALRKAMFSEEQLTKISKS